MPRDTSRKPPDTAELRRTYAEDIEHAGITPTSLVLAEYWADRAARELQIAELKQRGCRPQKR
jgi:hypothetical protein